jgi:hypothetical protein
MTEKPSGSRFCAKVTPLKNGGFALACFLDFTGEGGWAFGRVPVHDNPGPFRKAAQARAEAMIFAEVEGFRTHEVDFE